MKTLVRATALVAAVLSAACSGGDGGGGCKESGTGTLAVEIEGLPAGAAGAVTVEGAAAVVGSSQELTLDGGRHDVTAAVVAGPDEGIVREAYRGVAVPESPCVKAGKTTTVTVTYSVVPSSHRLWTSHGNATGNFVAFDGGLLAASGAPAATAVVGGGMTNPRGIAFDRDGNLWAVEGAGTLRMYRADTLATTGTTTADVEITGATLSGGIPGPLDLAFDAFGNLWVAVSAADKIVRYTPDQLATTGEPVPAVEISHADLEGPDALAFDAGGNLWIAAAAPSNVVRYDASRLGASTTAAPDLTLSAETPAPVIGELTTPSGLAFDEDGNLWVAYFAANVFARLTPANQALTGTQTITPDVQVGLTVSALLEGIAFDEGGGLWTPTEQGELGRITPAQLSTSGTITPGTIITSADLGYAAMPAFFPAPSFSPLYSALP